MIQIDMNIFDIFLFGFLLGIGITASCSIIFSKYDNNLKEKWRQQIPDEDYLKIRYYNKDFEYWKKNKSK